MQILITENIKNSSQHHDWLPWSRASYGSEIPVLLPAVKKPGGLIPPGRLAFSDSLNHLAGVRKASGLMFGKTPFSRPPPRRKSPLRL